MEDTTFLYGAIAVFALLTLATGIHAICKQMKIPFAVGLLLSGFLLAFVPTELDRLTNIVFDGAILKYFEFSPSIVFFVFLPTLIFESAYHLNYYHFRGVLREVSTLATFGLLISILVVSYGLHYFLGLPLGVSFLFGTLISATDPVAVLAIFKEFRAPKKLSTIVDGESLLNDGTALVIFQFLKAVVIGGGVVFSTGMIMSNGLELIESLVLGVFMGLIMGWLFSNAIANSRSKGVQLTLSLILAHATFLLAESVGHVTEIHVSGILATMMAGLVMGNYGKRKLDIKARKSFSEIWKFLGFVSNSLIFLLLGIKLGQVDFVQYWDEMLIASIVTIFLARPLSVFACFVVTNFFREKEEKISFKYQMVTMWGGLRGALGAAAVLLIPSTFGYAEILLALTAGVILGTFVINAMTMSVLLRKLNMIQLSDTEKLQNYEVQVLINEKICTQLKLMLERRYIPQFTFDRLTAQYNEATECAKKELLSLTKKLKKNDRENAKILTHYALGIELKSYEKLLEWKEISERRYSILQESIFRQLTRVENNELPEERKSLPKIAPMVPEKCWLCNYLEDGFLKRCVSLVFERRRNGVILQRLQHYRARRISSWKVIHDFEELKKNYSLFKDSKLIDKIIDRYQKWSENADRKTHELEERFPDVVVQARIQMAENVCLKKENEMELEFLERGMITEKVYETLENQIHCRSEKCRRNMGFKSWFKGIWEK